jgi:hypothetical protein
MASMVMPWKMAAAAMSMRLAISALRWPNSCTPSSRPVAGEPHGDAVAAGVVSLVVVGLRSDGNGVESSRRCFVSAQASAGSGLIEDLHDLGAEAASELAAPAERVLAGDAALLVRGGAEREVGLPEQPVVGGDTVSGGEYVGQAGPHLPVHGDRAVAAEGGSGVGSQARVGADSDDDQNHVRGSSHGRSVGPDRVDVQPPRPTRRGPADPPHGSAGENLDAAAGKLGVDQGAELGVDGRQHLGQLLHLSHRKPAGGESVGHLQADVASADDDGAGGSACSRVRNRSGSGWCP